MTDRLVKQISPPPPRSRAGARPFSEFTEEANIILLGEPGSGKTYLFEAFAASLGGRYITTRNFLSSPTLELRNQTFIDALDEKRAGRGDQDTIDLFVRKLFELRPGKIRISCRERDWLSETDLAAFRPYFDTTGYDYVVLMLQDLNRSQQEEILTSRGISAPDTFLDEATERGISAFLGNAQNVVMLSSLVQFGTWPDSRRALFEETARLLLSEHSRNRSRSGGGSYTAAELREAAGSILAASLISGVAGISLTSHLNNDDFPCFKEMPSVDTEKVLAALSRRLAILAGVNEGWLQSKNIKSFSRRALAIAFVLERAYLTEKDELEFHREGYGWIAAIQRDRPESVLDVYEQFARQQLRHNTRSSALDQVLSEGQFSDYKERFILRLLQEAADAEPEPLVQLLNSGFSHIANRRDFYQVVAHAAALPNRSDAVDSAWKAAAFLLSSETANLPARLSDYARSCVMDILRSSLALVRSNAKQAISVLSFMGENGSLPTNDVKLIEFLIARISLDPSHLAASYLQRSRGDERFVAFEGALSDALSNQQTRQREAV